MIEPEGLLIAEASNNRTRRIAPGWAVWYLLSRAMCMTSQASGEADNDRYRALA